MVYSLYFNQSCLYSDLLPLQPVRYILKRNMSTKTVLRNLFTKSVDKLQFSCFNTPRDPENIEIKTICIKFCR